MYIAMCVCIYIYLFTYSQEFKCPYFGVMYVVLKICDSIHLHDSEERPLYVQKHLVKSEVPCSMNPNAAINAPTKQGADEDVL